MHYDFKKRPSEILRVNDKPEIQFDTNVTRDSLKVCSNLHCNHNNCGLFVNGKFEIMKFKLK